MDKECSIEEGLGKHRGSNPRRVRRMGSSRTGWHMLGDCEAQQIQWQVNPRIHKTDSTDSTRAGRQGPWTARRWQEY